MFYTIPFPVHSRWFLFAAIALTSMLFARGVFAEPPSIRTYTQEIDITFASPEEAERATLTPLPVLDGKAWALSARWDDNHPGSVTMHDAMVKHGLKGTFYLNDAPGGDRFGVKFIDALKPGGFTIGGHSQTHPFLPPLAPNELFQQILANRVEREAQADQPIVSFAFPFGVWGSEIDPDAARRITESLRRGGLHHNTYSQFARKNPHAGENEFSTCNLIQPGDHQVDRAKFDANLEKFFKFPAAYQAFSHNITLSTHARQTGKAWEDLDALFGDLLTKSDWWICNQNEYAAYFREFHHTRIERVRTEGAAARFRVTRPIPSESGAVVPLTVEAKGGSILAAASASATHEMKRSDDGRTLLNLGHDANQVLPDRIDVVNNPDNGADFAGKGESGDFPGISAWLYRDGNQLVLHLANNAAHDLRDLRATVRLPLGYEVGVIQSDLAALAARQRRVERLDIGAASDDAVYRDGSPYYVVELDFSLGEERGRIFATTREPLETTARSCVRDAASMMGPMAPAEVDPEALEALSSQARPPLTNRNDTPNGRWFVATAQDRARFIGNCVTLFRNDPAWLAATKPFNQKEHVFLVVIDFQSNAGGDLTITGELPVARAFLNGVAIAADAPASGVVAGANRLAMVLDITDKRIYWKPMPVWLDLKVNDVAVDHLLPGEPETGSKPCPIES